MVKKNQLYSAILSLVIAFGLWYYVVSEVSQEDTRTFKDIPVTYAGEAVINDNKLMLIGITPEKVELQLTGPRSELNKIGSGKDMSVRVDLSSIREPGEGILLDYTPIYPVNVTSGSVTIQEMKQKKISVNVDYRSNKEIPVVLRWEGSRSEDYLYDTENAVLNSTTVTVSGPSKVVDRIDHAEVKVDLTGRTETFSESYRYTLCDETGVPVEAEAVNTSLEEIVLEKMPIRRIKEVRLAVDLVYGGGATQHNTSVSISPEVLRLTGSDAAMAELGDIYTVCTINLAELDRNENEIVHSLVLPDTVINQTGVSEVKVTVQFTGLVTREFTVSEFSMVNVPEGLEAEIINANLPVKVRGPAEQVNQMTAQDITVEVDFTDADLGTATYKSRIQIRKGFEQVGALKSYAVSARVQEKTEETEG